MSKKRIISIVIIVLCIISLIGFIVWKNIDRANREVSESRNTKIVASFYPMYIIAENLTEGARNIELDLMADVNVGCLHDYTLTTEDMKKVESADIFISNGLRMESFIDKILESNGNMKTIDSSMNIQNLISEGEETNPHLWTSIEKYIAQVENISEGLQESDPDNAEIYEQNTVEYINKLEQLESEFEEQLGGLKGQKAICLNETFEYFGQELGMDLIVVETDHEESTISAEELKNIIDTSKSENIDMILIDKNDNKSNAETIANETGAKIYELNSGLTGSTDKDAYISQMRENIQILLGD